MATETFRIPRRWGLSAFEVEITCAPDASQGVKLGLAVRAKFASGADLSDADLRGADLSGAVLRGKKVERLLAVASRLDGYEFRLWRLQGGDHIIIAGCQTRTIPSYREHIAADYPGTAKAVETGHILNFFQARLDADELAAAQPQQAAS